MSPTPVKVSNNPCVKTIPTLLGKKEYSLINTHLFLRTSNFNYRVIQSIYSKEEGRITKMVDGFSENTLTAIANVATTQAVLPSAIQIRNTKQYIMKVVGSSVCGRYVHSLKRDYFTNLKCSQIYLKR